LPDFSWYTIPKTGKMHQINTKCTKCPKNIPNGNKIFQHFPFLGPLKIYPNLDFGLKINHLATLVTAPEENNISAPDPVSHDDVEHFDGGTDAGQLQHGDAELVDVVDAPVMSQHFQKVWRLASGKIALFKERLKRFRL
jgi:hypothetical protein